MKTKQEAIQEQIDEIMDTFDFGRVHKWMKHDQWTWGDEGVPDEAALRMAARERLICAARCKGVSSTGGFTAEYVEAKDEYGAPFIRMDLHFGYSSINDGTTFSA